MSKFTEEFSSKYVDTNKLRMVTKELIKKRSLNKSMKQADINLTKVTQGKLGRTL